MQTTKGWWLCAKVVYGSTYSGNCVSPFPDKLRRKVGRIHKLPRYPVGWSFRWYILHLFRKKKTEVHSGHGLQSLEDRSEMKGPVAMNVAAQKNTLWEDTIYVKSYDVDHTGRLKLASLFNYFQETAGNHATHLGVGYEKLRSLGFFWVLSRAKVQINRLPEWRETVALTTWPKGQEGLLFMRDFRLLDEHHETIVTGSTGWLLIDTEYNKPHLARDLQLTLPANEHGHAIETPLKKLRQSEKLDLAYKRRVLPSDLDVNNHVNNARYLEWITDCFDIQHAASSAVSAIQVNYVGEAVLDDVVCLHKTPDQSGNSTYIEGVIDTKGIKVVQAVLEWK